MKKCKFISGQEYNGDQENIKSGRKFHHEGNFLHGKILKKDLRKLYSEGSHRNACKRGIAAVSEKYETENERIAREYIGDGQPLFSNEVKDLPKWNPQNEKCRKKLFSSLQQLLWISEERMKFSVRK